MKERLRQLPLETPEWTAFGNLVIIATALLASMSKEDTVTLAATAALAAATLAAPPLAVWCWVRSNRKPEDPLPQFFTMGAISAVQITTITWAVAASELYETPYPALAVATLQLLTLIPHWRLFRRIMRAPVA